MTNNSEPVLPPDMSTFPDQVEEERAQARLESDTRELSPEARESLLKEAAKNADRLISDRAVLENRLAELSILASIAELSDAEREEQERLRATLEK